MISRSFDIVHIFFKSGNIVNPYSTLGNELLTIRFRSENILLKYR